MAEADTLIKWFIRRTTKQNRNVILAVQGSQGSGKSYSCVRILERVHEDLGREGKPNITHCCRDLIEFMQLLNSGTLRRGDVVILEEVGVNMGSKDWQSKMNRLINHVIQVFRDQNLIVLLNLVDLRMLDSDTRRLIHGVITMKGINFGAKTTTIAVKLRQHNFELQKDYWKYPRKTIKGRQMKIKRMTLKKPSDWLCDIYEKRRSEFSEVLKKRVERDIGIEIEKRDGNRKKGTGKPFTEFQWGVHDWWHKGVKKFIDIAKKMDRSPTYISFQVKSMNKKFPSWAKTPIKKEE